MYALNDLLNKVRHKNEFKTTTTLKFKSDLFEILTTGFSGDILEVGTSTGNTTVILSFVGELMDKKVYSFDNNMDSIREARQKCNKLGLGCNIIYKDVYSSEWGLSNIGCVFIDCVHTEKCFEQDLKNAIKITSWVQTPILIAHDYGLKIASGDSISYFMKRNDDKYRIVRYVGEKDAWNPIGTGKVIDWEGIQIGIK